MCLVNSDKKLGRETKLEVRILYHDVDNLDGKTRGVVGRTLKEYVRTSPRQDHINSRTTVSSLI